MDIVADWACAVQQHMGPTGGPRQYSRLATPGRQAVQLVVAVPMARQLLVQQLCCPAQGPLLSTRVLADQAAAAAAFRNTCACAHACSSCAVAVPASTAWPPAPIADSQHITFLTQRPSAAPARPICHMHQQQHLPNTCLPVCLPQLPDAPTCSARISSLTWPRSAWNLPSRPSMCSRMESQCLICNQSKAAAITGYPCTSHNC
jgi:hypothetical protein